MFLIIKKLHNLKKKIQSFENVRKTDVWLFQNEEIQFTVSTRATAGAMGDGIIGGSYSETYVVQCLELDQAGVLFNTSDEMVVLV